MGPLAPGREPGPAESSECLIKECRSRQVGKYQITRRCPADSGLDSKLSQAQVCSASSHVQVLSIRPASLGLTRRRSQQQPDLHWERPSLFRASRKLLEAHGPSLRCEVIMTVARGLGVSGSRLRGTGRDAHTGGPVGPAPTHRVGKLGQGAKPGFICPRKMSS